MPALLGIISGHCARCEIHKKIQISKALGQAKGGG
jgi:hypothetical protein